jgi:hypothetical protein
MFLGVLTEQALFISRESLTVEEQALTIEFFNLPNLKGPHAKLLNGVGSSFAIENDAPFGGLVVRTRLT